MSKIKCKQCGTTLRSSFSHEYVKCSCSNETFVDGGTTCTRFGGKDFTQIEVIEAYMNGRSVGDDVWPRSNHKNSSPSLPSMSMDDYVDSMVRLVTSRVEHDGGNLISRQVKSAIKILAVEIWHLRQEIEYLRGHEK